MDFDKFTVLVQKIRTETPAWFESPSDPLPTDECIRRAEEQLDLKFPPEYVMFLRAYGGGYFAFVNVFSVDPASDWNVVKRNAAIQAKGFLAISDDESGGYYGFRTTGGVCGSEVVYFDFETLEILRAPTFRNLFEYLLEFGLQNKRPD